MRSQDRRFLTDLSVIKKQPRSDFTYVIYLLSVDALKYVRTYARMPVRLRRVCTGLVCVCGVRTYVRTLRMRVALILIFIFEVTRQKVKKLAYEKQFGEICFPVKIS